MTWFRIIILYPNPTFIGLSETCPFLTTLLTSTQRERERQRKSRSLFAAAKKKQLKVSPKDKSWGGIRASLPFCVYMCLFCCDLHYFNPFTVQIILHPAQEHKQMQKRPKTKKKYLKFHAKITIAFVSLIFEHLECDVNYGHENSNRYLKKSGNNLVNWDCF